MKKYLIFIVLGSIIVALSITVILLIIKVKQIKEYAQTLEYKLEEKEERERARKKAWRNIIIEKFDISVAFLKGGINLNWIQLYNPTNYTFVDIQYEFYDADDNVVKIRGNISGPLSPQSREKFYIERWTEGLWEHEYGIRIVGAKALE